MGIDIGWGTRTQWSARQQYGKGQNRITEIKRLTEQGEAEQGEAEQNTTAQHKPGEIGTEQKRRKNPNSTNSTNRRPVRQYERIDGQI